MSLGKSNSNLKKETFGDKSRKIFGRSFLQYFSSKLKLKIFLSIIGIHMLINSVVSFLNFKYILDLDNLNLPPPRLLNVLNEKLKSELAIDLT